MIINLRESRNSWIIKLFNQQICFEKEQIRDGRKIAEALLANDCRKLTKLRSEISDNVKKSTFTEIWNLEELITARKKSIEIFKVFEKNQLAIIKFWSSIENNLDSENEKEFLSKMIELFKDFNKRQRAGERNGSILSLFSIFALEMNIMEEKIAEEKFEVAEEISLEVQPFTLATL